GAGRRLFIIDDAAPQQVADVGGERVYLTLVPIERQGEKASLLEPEIAVEAVFEQRGLALELVCPARVVPHRAREPGRAHLGVVQVALQLAGGARRWGDGAVREGDGVP